MTPAEKVFFTLLYYVISIAIGLAVSAGVLAAWNWFADSAGLWEAPFTWGTVVGLWLLLVILRMIFK